MPPATSCKVTWSEFAGGLDVRYQSDVLSENNYYLFTNLKPAAVGGKLSDGKDAISYRASEALIGTMSYSRPRHLPQRSHPSQHQSRRRRLMTLLLVMIAA